MLGGSSPTPKETLSHTYVPPIPLCRSFRLPAARWVQWMPTVATVPALPTCGRPKNSYTKRHPRLSLQHVHTRLAYRRQRRRVRTAAVTKARTTNRRCAQHGACAAAMTAGMTVMMRQRMGKASILMKTRMAQEICAWRARLPAPGGSAALSPYTSWNAPVAFSIPVEPHLSPHHTYSCTQSSSVPLTDRDNFLFCTLFRALDICLRVSSCQNPLPSFFFVSLASFSLFGALHGTRACCTHTQYFQH
jgi:hypothetical protein